MNEITYNGWPMTKVQKALSNLISSEDGKTFKGCLFIYDHSFELYFNYWYSDLDVYFNIRIYKIKYED